MNNNAKSFKIISSINQVQMNIFVQTTQDCLDINLYYLYIYKCSV